MSERTSWREIKKARSEAAQRAYEDEARVSEFRDLVYRLRTEAELTQAELAGRMGTTQSAIARMEGGGSRPTLETLEKLAGAVGQELVVGVGEHLSKNRSIAKLVREGALLFAERDSRAISRDDDPEFLFEAYLRTIGLDYAYEHEIGGRLPDFWIPSAEAPSVVCEITEVQKCLPARAGSIDASKPVRVKIKKKAPQGKGVGELGVPYVIVLRSQSWPLDELSVSGAMFGRVGFTLPFDPIAGALDSARAEPSFEQDAQLQEHQHSHVSAVAVLKLFNPTIRAAKDTFDERVARQRMQGDFDLAALFEARLEVFEELKDAGSFDPDALIPRLVIYRNVYAVNPLPSDLLAGPFDETWGEVDGHWIQTAVGIKRNLIPD